MICIAISMERIRNIEIGRTGLITSEMIERTINIILLKIIDCYLSYKF